MVKGGYAVYFSLFSFLFFVGLVKSLLSGRGVGGLSCAHAVVFCWQQNQDEEELG